MVKYYSEGNNAQLQRQERIKIKISPFNILNYQLSIILNSYSLKPKERFQSTERRR